MTRKECLEQATKIVEEMKGYESLVQVYQDAVIQASKGKGRERHANEGEAYEDQIICEVARRVGLGYPLGQAVKKIYESQRIGGERGVAELLGTLNYVAAAVIVMREGVNAAPKAEGNCFQNGNSSPESSAEPEFKSGDKVQARLGDGVWRDAVVTGKEIIFGKLHYTVKIADFNGYYGLKVVDVRPAPKAEGCEELVQDNEVERVFGTLKKRPAPEYDAPQTREALYQHIVDANPSVYPRKPTGEELAEMAEEDVHE